MEFKSLYDEIIEQVKSIETEGLSDIVPDGVKTDVVEEQKIYVWVRVFLKEEIEDLNIGDDYTLTYKPSGESINMKFIAYGKKGQNFDHVGVINYESEDNKEVICLMVDEDIINNKSEDIPFIRTLFTTSKWRQNQVYRRSDLVFTNQRTGTSIPDYINCSF
jgi:hypothetical protein